MKKITAATVENEGESMAPKRTTKPYWELTTAELREATKEFDEEFIAEKSRPLTPAMKATWERAKAKLGRAGGGDATQTIAVRLDKTLLDRCTALAKKKRLSRDALVARGLRALLAAEGEYDAPAGCEGGQRARQVR
jgi:hypothetical protein